MRRPLSLLIAVFLLGIPLTGMSCSAAQRSSGFSPEGGTHHQPDFNNGDADIIAPDDQKPTGDKCHVPEDSEQDNAPRCEAPPAPPDSFKPVIKWKWTDPDPSSIGAWAIPLVGNFTDDDDDGEVNLCDIPDVIIQTAGSGEMSRSGHIYMLRGDTGKLETNFGNLIVDGDVTPALADLDGDKVPEVITVDQPGHIVILGANGKIKRMGDIAAAATITNASCAAISVYDLDGDGSPEIIYGFEVFDSKGKSLWNRPPAGSGGFESDYWCPAPIAADLDDDGMLEVIFGNSAYRFDGQPMWNIGGPPGQPQIANLDDDPEPEIFLARNDGLLVIEHNGKIKFGPVQPFDPGVQTVCWDKAAAIHDFDGDGVSDIAESSCNHYGVFRVLPGGLQMLWSKPVDDTSGIASSTGFDFLGRGIADAVYGDQGSLLVFDGKTGRIELQRPRASGTIIEYPVVADVDNDGSADILVVSNGSGGQYPALQVFEDEDKRWIPTRRIWNQHAYHVTNVREDGTIPAKMKKNWQLLNTFRTNAQIENGGDCAPPPANPK
jgi:hypothetical protein